MLHRSSRFRRNVLHLLHMQGVCHQIILMVYRDVLIHAQAALLFVFATSWVGNPDSTHFTASLSTENAAATRSETWDFWSLRVCNRRPIIV